MLALFASAFVLYVVASIAASGAELDGGTVTLALVAAGCALAPVWLRTHAARDESSARVAALGLVLSVALAAQLSMHSHTLLGEFLSALSLPAAGLAVLRLALEVPDRPRALARMHWPLPVAALLALCSALLGAAAAAPPLWLNGRAHIAPHAWSLAPSLALCGCSALALGLRLSRRALGSDARALAANLWGTLGAATMLAMLGLFTWLSHGGAPQSVSLALLALAAAACLGGHVCMVLPSSVRSAGPLSRRLFALVVAGAMACAMAALLMRFFAASGWPLVAPVLALFALVHALLVRTSERVLAPAGGALCGALREIEQKAYGALDYEEFAARVLKPLRRAAGLPEAAPLLATFDPAHIAQLDAAGNARVQKRELSRSIVQRLRERPGEPVVHSELSSALARRPDLVGLVRALEELEALCVMPLQSSGELDGALIVARGTRTSPLTLEELLELERTAQALAPVVASFLSLERTRTRADRAEAEQRELLLSREQQRHDVAELRAQVNAVKAGLGLPLPVREPVQYSASMRALLERLSSFAGHELPVLLWGEPGASFAAIAQSLQRASGRENEPFVIIDGAALDSDAAVARLFGCGEGANQKPGVLELVERGTVLVLDLPAVPTPVQRALVEALEERRVRAADAGSSRPFEARIVATAQRDLLELTSARAILPELARWFEATACRVPPLRERPEDFESLLLLALDRAARVLGLPAKGVDGDALRVLLGYDWPGNEAELTSVIERAFARARGPRLTVADLALLSASAFEAQQGTWLEQERAIVRRALRQTGGNPNRAARALGMKRAAFDAKLRELGLTRRGDSAEN